MKFTTLIPKTWNDGRPVDPDLHQSLIDSIHNQFGGMTIEGDVTGYWTDDDGTKYVDKSSKVSVECDRSRLQEAIKLRYADWPPTEAKSHVL
jgi:hypothetical protein